MKAMFKLLNYHHCDFTVVRISISKIIIIFKTVVMVVSKLDPCRH